MKKILLDTSFILSAIRNKIDFFEELLNYKIIIPNQVLKEIQSLAISGKSKSEAKTAIKILASNKNLFEIIDLKTKITDKGIINYSKQIPELIVGVLDREIKTKIPNQKIVIRGNKKLEII